MKIVAGKSARVMPSSGEQIVRFGVAVGVCWVGTSVTVGGTGLGVVVVVALGLVVWVGCTVKVGAGGVCEQLISKTMRKRRQVLCINSLTPRSSDMPVIASRLRLDLCRSAPLDLDHDFR